MPGRILLDLTPLRQSRDFRLLFTGQLVSMLGTQLTVVAIPYQVYHLTHSWLIFLLAGWAGLVLALGWAASRLAGHDPDRRSRGSLQAIVARFAIGGLIAGGVDVVLVGTLVFIGRVWLWWY